MKSCSLPLHTHYTHVLVGEGAVKSSLSYTLHTSTSQEEIEREGGREVTEV